MSELIVAWVAIIQTFPFTSCFSKISSIQGIVIDRVFFWGNCVCRGLIAYAAAVLHAIITIFTHLLKSRFKELNVICLICSQDLFPYGQLAVSAKNI